MKKLKFIAIFLAFSCSISCNSETCQLPVIMESFRELGYEEVTLSTKLSISEIEVREAVSIDGISVPFGYTNNLWEEIKTEYQEGDCLLFFTTNDLSWNALAGRQGYILIRNNEIVQFIFTKLS